MNKRRWVITTAVMGGLTGWGGQALAASAAGPGVCASTPAAALVAVNDKHSANASALADSRGYRVTFVRWDSLQRQNWAVITSCDHPERPSMTILMDTPVQPRPANVADVRSPVTVPIVRAGDLVRLWKIDHDAQIEMVATSEENGVLGARVRVRLATASFGEGQVAQPQYFAAIVRGPADVEMER